MPSYRMQISLSGVASFKKEYRPVEGDGGIRSGKKLASISDFNGELPLDQWIGVKFVVAELSNEEMKLELYMDLSGGGDASAQNWTLIHSYIDSPGAWKAEADSFPQDTCASSLENGAVFTGRKMYGILDNVGNTTTRVMWRSVSIRSISSATMESACTGVAPAMSPVTIPPSMYSSDTPSTISESSTKPTASPVSTSPQSATETNSPSSAPIKSYTIVGGMLNFKLPTMGRLLDGDEAVEIEATIEDFLQSRLKKYDFENTTIEFSRYDATIVKQTLVADNDTEPVRRLEYASLVIDATVTARLTPAEIAGDFPFQRVIHDIISLESSVFYASDVFEDILSPEKSLEYVNLESRGDGNNKTLAVGSSIAGFVMLLVLVVAFFVIRRRHEADEEGSEEEPPQVCTFGQLELQEGDCDMSSLDDSLLVDKYPNNVPHLPGGSLPSTSNVGTAEELDRQQLDAWSLDDSYPLKQNEDQPNIARAMSHTQTVCDSDENTTTSSFKAELKQDTFIPCDEENANKVQPNHDVQSIQSEEADLQRLYGKAMGDESVDTKDDADLVDTSVEEDVQAPTPKGLKLFSCFADNTFEEPTLTTQKLLGRNYRSDATPKASNVTGNVYEVRARPGPLGILIDSSKDGPVVHEVKGKFLIVFLCLLRLFVFFSSCCGYPRTLTIAILFIPFHFSQRVPLFFTWLTRETSF